MAILFYIYAVPANITAPPLDILVSIAATAVFTCEAYGFPTPNIFWAKINAFGNTEYLSDFTPEARSNFTSVMRTFVLKRNVTAGTVSSMLEIQNVQASDEGVYICLASNGVTVANLTTIRENASAVLTIQG